MHSGNACADAVGAAPLHIERPVIPEVWDEAESRDMHGRFESCVVQTRVARYMGSKHCRKGPYMVGQQGKGQVCCLCCHLLRRWHMSFLCVKIYCRYRAKSWACTCCCDLMRYCLRLHGLLDIHTCPGSSLVSYDADSTSRDVCERWLDAGGSNMSGT